jgi:arylsulfatase A-like enzyme
MNLMKRSGVCLFSFTVFLTACGEKVTEVEKVSELPSRPNVIVVLADDMRANYTGFEGHPLVETPNIDKLARQGTFFSNAFATSAVCTPSRTSLLTGLYERRHGVNFNSGSAMTEEAFQQTYPMILKDAGYFVGYIGKNHTPVGKNVDGVIGYKSGVMDESFDYWYAGHRHLGFYPKKRHPVFDNANADTQVEIMEEGMENFFAPDMAFQAGYDFLNARPDDQPFALLLNFNVPHGAGTSSMELRDSDLALYRTAYRDEADMVTAPESYIAESDIVEPKLPKHVYNGETISQYDYVKIPDTLRERQIRTLQTISGIDKLLGKLLKQLEQQGVEDNTIIVFTSDHGLLFGEFGMGGKVFVYDASAKIPLIIYDPRLNKDARVDNSNELVALVDIAPTLLDFTGVSIPEEMQGRSVKPLMQGQETEWRQDLFLENMMTIQNYPRIEAVRTHKWKYIRYFDREKDQVYGDMLVASIKGEKPIYEELFDLENDPRETHNVVADAANSEIVSELSDRTSELVEEYRGTRPLNTYIDADIVGKIH